MEKIFSKVDPKILLHIIYEKKDFAQPRVDLSPNEEFIQTCCLVFHNGREVPAHKHLENKRITNITQETLIIIEGELEASYYDIDNSFIKKFILKDGDCSVTFRGGHGFKSLKDNTKIYEIKNGPYFNREKDKVELKDV